MDTFFILCAVVAIDVLALRYGADSRFDGERQVHERARNAARASDGATWEAAMREIDRSRALRGF